jgi:enoyl-CoA hydratase/carnithine racemase
VSAPSTIFETSDAVATLSFNRPEASNALTWEMYDDILRACDAVDADPGIRVFVIKGAPGKAFAAGTDISQFTSLRTPEDAVAYERRLEHVFGRLEAITAATIAQVEGVAAGGGCVVALACDLRVCTPSARFGVPIARTLGNCLSGTNCVRLLDLVGPARLKDLLFTGRLIDAHEAAALGLVTRMAEPDTVDAVTAELAATLVANAPLTIRATKEALRRLRAGRNLDRAAFDDLIVSCYTSEDFQNAVRAFLDKTRPNFLGR